MPHEQLLSDLRIIRRLAGAFGVSLLLVLPSSAGAVIRNGAPAIDALGQYDEDPLNDPGPIYTKGRPNDAPNRLGYSSAASALLDSTGDRFFVTDVANSRVLVYNLNADDTFPDRIPDAVLGRPDFADGRVATNQAIMHLPLGLAHDAANNLLFVADSFNNRVLVFDVAQITNGENAVNVLGQPDFRNDREATTQAGMYRPAGLAYDEADRRLFVVDGFNHRVLVFNLSDGITNGMNARHVLGSTIFTLGPGLPTGPSTMFYPENLTYDESNRRLFVADSGHHRVLVFDLSGGITNGMNASNVLGQPDFGGRDVRTTQAGMYRPAGLAYDKDNERLFVADRENNRVLTFDVATISNGKNATNVLGQPDFRSGGQRTTQAGMHYPNGLAYDESNRRLFVAQFNNHRVTVYDVATITNGENAVDALGQTDGDLANPAPIYTKGEQHDAPNRLGLSEPYGIVVDSAGDRLFVAEFNNRRVLVYNLNADDTLVDRIPDNVLGQTNFYSRASAVTQSGLSGPYGLAYDSTNARLFVSEPNPSRVLVYDVSSITDGEGAVNVLGQSSFTTQISSVTRAGMRAPQGLAYDSVNSRLFVADYSANRVTTYNVSSIINGESAVNVLGQSSFTTQISSVTQAGMNAPYDLTYDSTNARLFVADSFNNRVLVFSAAEITDGENAVNVLGQAGFTTRTAETTRAGMRTPQGLAYDESNQILFVAGNAAHRVTTYDVSSIINGEDAVNVLGQTTFISFVPSITQVGMYDPEYLAYDRTNERLYVTQAGSHRVTVYDGAAANRAPIAEAGISVDGGTPASIVNVFQGESVTVRLFADRDVTGDKRASRDPDGWTDADFGVASGGNCEWNRDLNLGAPTFDPPIIRNPATPTACNISLGPLTFNDSPGTYTYQVLRITDKPGSASLVASVSVRVRVRPDLGVQLPTGQSLYRSIASPFTGDPLTFSFRVENVFHAAGTTAGASTARVCMDDPCYQDPAANVISTHNVLVLANGDSTGTITSGPWTATAGSHTVTLCADIPGGAGVVPEREEAATSNCASETFTVAGPADLTVSSITITPPRPLLGDPLNVDAVIENVGGIASLASSARLDVDRDGDGVFETLVTPDQNVPALDPRATAEVSWPNATTAAVGRMVFRVCVDPASQNPEDCLTREQNRPPFRPGRFREAPP